MCLMASNTPTIMGLRVRIFQIIIGAGKPRENLNNKFADIKMCFEFGHINFC